MNNTILRKWDYHTGGKSPRAEAKARAGFVVMRSRQSVWMGEEGALKLYDDGVPFSAINEEK